MRKSVFVGIVLVMILGTAVFIGCEDTGGAEAETIELAHGNWTCATAKTYLAAGVIEEEMGFDVEITMADLGMVFSDVANGEQDIYIATWLPVTHESYMDEHSDDLENLGTVYDNARIGLVVPDYIDIDSIDEMDEHRDKFQEKIVGIEEGAGIMQNTNDALEEYDSLAEYELLTSSEASMIAELRDAIDNEEWVVVTGWTPHWKFADWDLKFLEDPDNIYGDAERVDAVTRKGFSEENAEVAEFIENFYVDDEQLSKLMAMIEESDDPMGSALEWIEENQDTVQDWIS
ncbi:glycine betaine ABC transporter substrate-binding protein [Natranaerobius trueperi]|uniref:Glycine/betaine ABC transporter n=1 Tax=Natranaerobius trueperi TaxID=759412 RepID=A0A226C2I7_9FIRM|nr:glycine betaine ABC transporter substrate-binding protein [Natranaerobius trueperi]OWZ84627.1 glycine/betaine ABC transporter [Natranaerobius trueperi]